MADEIKLIIDASQVFASLDKVDQQLAELQQSLAKIPAASKAAFNVAPVSQYQADAQKASDQIADLKKKLGEADQAAAKTAKAPIIGAQALKNTQVAGQSVAEWGEQLRQAASNLAGAESGTGKLATAQRVLNLVLKASPIALLIGLVAAVIGYFGRFQSGIDKVSQVMAGFNAIVDVLISRFLKFGSAIANVLSGNFSQAAEDLKDSISGIGSELVNAAIGAANLEKEFQNIRDASRTLSVEIARQQVALEGLRQAGDNEAISTSKRVKALQGAAKAEKEIADQLFDAALRRQQEAQLKFAENPENQQARDEAAKAEIELAQATIAVNNAGIDSLQKIRDLRKKASDERKKQVDDELKALERLQKALESLRVATAPEGLEKELAEVNKKYDELAKVAAAGVAKLQEIEAKRGLTQEQKAQLEEFSALQIGVEEKRFDELTRVLLDFNDKENALNAEQEKRKKELADRILAGDIKALEAQRNLRDQEISIAEEKAKKFIAVAKANGASEREIGELQVQFDIDVQRARLENQLRFQEQLLAIIGTSDAAQAESIKKSIDLINAQLATLEVPDAGVKKKQSLWDVLGIDTSTEDGAAFAKQAEEMAGRLIASIQAITAARVAAAEEEVAAAEDRIEAAQRALDTEIQLAELGFASNVTIRKKELEDAKKNQAAALAEKQKAARAQLLVDSLTQASSIATSAVNLIQSWSSLPFGVGLIAAAAQIAGMIAFIVSTRAKARAISRARYGASGFLDGDGIVRGRYHSHGGEALEVEHGEMVQVGQDGGRRRVEVVRRERVAQYMNLLKAANSGDRLAIAQQALQLADVSSLPLSAQRRLFGRAASQDIGVAFAATPTVSRRRVERRVFGDGQQPVSITVGGDNARTNELLEKLIRITLKAQKNETWSPDGKTKRKGSTKIKYV